MTTFQDDKQQQNLRLLRRKEEEASIQMLAERHHLPYIDFANTAVEIDAIQTIPEEQARFGEVVIFQKNGKQLKIGVLNPKKEETQAVIKNLRRDRYVCELHLISRSSFDYAMRFYGHSTKKEAFEAGSIDVSLEKVASLRRRIHNVEEIKREIERVFYSRVTDALEVILAGALAVEASDVHIEPFPDHARLRFRLDGILEDIISLPMSMSAMLLSRIKLVSELKLNIHDKPQDGRFTISLEPKQVEVRVSLLPGPSGENIVMRVLDPKSIEVSIDALGMQPWIADTIKKEIKKTQGMILTTGPTGSGKTTALYTFLKETYTPEIKVITIEDPIEYHIDGVEQTQVNPERGYSFANGLRSIIRQDPDAILVGEIRDLETAETAMHAALTGHLVFSTLHTNNAAGTVPRLIDLGVRPVIIAPAINIAMAQRLLRRLCPKCRDKTEFTTEERREIEKDLKTFPPNISIPPPEHWQLYRAAKSTCLHCRGTGYRGRTGLFEIIQIDDEIERLILKQPSEYEMQQQILRQGQINMRQDGILKILAGITDFTELNRVMNV